MAGSHAPVVDGFLTTQDVEILRVLQRAGPMTAQSLAAAVAMSRTAVLRRLALLGAQALVDRRAVPRGVGRPRHLYDVTPASHASPLTEYDELVGTLLDAMVDVGGHELVARVFDARRRRSVAQLRRVLDAEGGDEAPLADRARVLAAWLDRHGFAADVVDVHGLHLRVHGCPILRVAAASPAACDAELRLVAEALGVDVEREALIATGARRCLYRLTPRAAAIPAPVWRARQMVAGPVDASERTAADDPPVPVWRREHMLPGPSRPRGAAASRWPPSAATGRGPGT